MLVLKRQTGQCVVAHQAFGVSTDESGTIGANGHSRHSTIEPH